MILRELTNLFSYWQKHPIASKSMGSTLGMFLRWQLGTRLLRKPVLWTWINNTKLIVEKGMTGATMNVYCGLHEFRDMGFLLHFLKAEDIFLDIGANVGAYTVLASGVAKAQTIAVEPVPSTFEKLLLNLAVNNLSSLVKPVCCGIGSEDNTVLTFISDQDTTNRIAPSGYTGKTAEVRIQTIDTLLENKEAVLWKVDVEGHEEAVLFGAQKVLAKSTLKAIILEGDSPTIRQTMNQYGFKNYHYDPFERVFTPNTERSEHNFLYIRDLAFVERRCRSAAPIIVNRTTF